MSKIPQPILDTNFAHVMVRKGNLYIWEENDVHKNYKIEVTLHELPRAIFDRIRGTEKEYERIYWVKTIRESVGVELSFYTDEPPVEKDE